MNVNVILGVPVDSSGAFAGCERMPAALRQAGLAQGVPVRDMGNLQVSLADPVRDPETGIIGYASLLDASQVIRTSVRDILAGRQRPLIVGGCCSLLIGVAAGLADTHPRAGLVFIDGHLDLHTGRSSPTGEAADMELAIILGIGPTDLITMTGRRRILDPASVVHLGARDHDRAAAAGGPEPADIAPDMLYMDQDALLRAGPASAGACAAAALAGHDGFWVHVDLDVLSTTEFPAVDYPQLGGLTWDQLTALVDPLTSAPGFLGMNVTILNPTKDPETAVARRTVRWLRDVLWSD
jgi:arginase